MRSFPSLLKFACTCSPLPRRCQIATGWTGRKSKSLLKAETFQQINRLQPAVAIVQKKQRSEDRDVVFLNQKQPKFVLDPESHHQADINQLLNTINALRSSHSRKTES
jgi:hypothetical protein